MSLKTNRFPRVVMLSAFAGFALTACDDGFTLNELGDKIDRPPSTQTTSATSRPSADANGIISYPTYQVAVAQRDETVGEVANRVGISADKLASHNGLETNSRLSKGDILAIPKGEQVGGWNPNEVGSALDDSIDTTPLNASGNAPVRHTVRSGETAYTIARLYGVSVTSLASWNNLDRDLSLRNGQQLLVPTSSSAPAPDSVASNPGAGTTVSAPPSSSKPLPKPTPPAVVAPKPVAPAASKLSKPVNGKVLRGFSAKSGGNEGIDYAAPTGTSVTAAADGTVALISDSVGDTTIVLIRHANNLYTVYSNITNVALRKGGKVGRGEPVGIIAGGTPPFVHFEVRKGTQAVDPTPYLN